MRSPPRGFEPICTNIQRMQRTTALLRAEKVRLRSKVVVIRLLLAVCGGDGGGSGGSDGGMSTGF